MSLLQLFFHLSGFVLPALAMALAMPLAGRWVMGRSGLPWTTRALWHALAAVLVLALGLLVQGSDGRMLTYGALVLVASVLEWGLQGGWRR